MPVSPPISAAPPLSSVARSVDGARLLQRSLRCFRFGLASLVPLAGMGLALQSFRMAREIFRELEQDWRPPRAGVYSLLAAIFMGFYGKLHGPLAFLSVLALFLGLTAWHSWRTFPPPSRLWWNPAQRRLQWGVLLAQASCLLNLAMYEGLIGLLLFREEP